MSIPISNATYNITQLQQAENISSLFIYANDVTRQSFSIFLLLTIFFVVSLVLMKWGFEKAVLTSSWITCVLSLFFLSMGMINILVVGFFGFIGGALIIKMMVKPTN